MKMRIPDMYSGHILYVKENIEDHWENYGQYSSYQDALESFYMHVESVNIALYYQITYNDDIVDSGYVAPG